MQISISANAKIKEKTKIRRIDQLNAQNIEKKNKKKIIAKMMLSGPLRPSYPS